MPRIVCYDARMRLALIADWLSFGGAEQAISEFTEIWPDAPLFTTVASRRSLGALSKTDIRESRLKPLYRIIGSHQPLLPWMPRAIEDMDVRGFDVILSSSHAVGKGIIPDATATHICYCHTPMRYAWEMEETYLRDFGVPRIIRGRVKRQLSRLRRWDLTTAKRVDVFIANSTETKQRISRIYGRESIVIPPPVHDRFFSEPLVPLDKRDYFLAVGRLVPYKRFDLLIALANELRLPLIIAGKGQEDARLRKMAGATVKFLGFVPDEKLPSLYAGAKALLFPPHEDAGIVPLEAEACGTPVIAYGMGGALDTVSDGETGVLFSDQTVPSFADAINRFSSMKFDSEKIRRHARGFSSSTFRKKISAIVRETAMNRKSPAHH